MTIADRPYEPSWVDRLTNAIDRLSTPAWLFYLMVAVPLVAVFVSVQAWQGAYRVDGFFPWHIFIAVQPLYGVMTNHYLDRFAVDALRKFRPAMKGDENEYEWALFQLTNMPARPLAIAGVLGALTAIIQILLAEDAEMIAAFQSIAPTSISLAVHNVNITVAWIGYGTTIYHAYHQLKVINWLYTSQAEIDPFHPEPLYALSDITSRTALFILAAIYGWFLVVSAGSLVTPLANPNYILTSVFWLALGLLVFIWPLWGAHQQLVEAKNSALESNAESYKAAADALHRTVLANNLDEIDVWNKAISALDVERRHLDRMATWPWSPGALRNLMLALILPILVWIIQFGLERLLE